MVTDNQNIKPTLMVTVAIAMSSFYQNKRSQVYKVAPLSKLYFLSVELGVFRNYDNAKLSFRFELLSNGQVWEEKRKLSTGFIIDKHFG